MRVVPPVEEHRDRVRCGVEEGGCITQLQLEVREDPGERDDLSDRHDRGADRRRRCGSA